MHLRTSLCAHSPSPLVPLCPDLSVQEDTTQSNVGQSFVAGSLELAATHKTESIVQVPCRAQCSTPSLCRCHRLPTRNRRSGPQRLCSPSQPTCCPLSFRMQTQTYDAGSDSPVLQTCARTPNLLRTYSPPGPLLHREHRKAPRPIPMCTRAPLANRDM